MKKYMKDLDYFLGNRIYIICIMLTTFICYGYAALHTTISIDDLVGERYIGTGNEMISAGRFGNVIWAKLFGYKTNLPHYSAAIEILAIFFLMWATINFCILFHRILKDKGNIVQYLVFSCIFISYPLINEIWEYTPTNLYVGVGYFCVSIALIITWNSIHSKKNMYSFLATSIILMIVSASYESLVVAYIFMVFVVLTLQVISNDKEEKMSMVIKQGLEYAVVLTIGILLRFIVGKIIRSLGGIPNGVNGATNIKWGTAPLLRTFKEMVGDILNDYFVRAIIYFPVTEFIVCVVILIAIGVYLLIRLRCKSLLLTMFGMLISPFLLCFLQGTATPYRACQVFGLFVAFTIMLLLMTFYQKIGICKLLYNFLLVCCVLLCVQQSTYLSSVLALNHLRSEEEANVIRNIGQELDMIDEEKPVIFVGKYSLSKYVTQSSQLGKNDVRWKWYSHVLAKVNGFNRDDVYENYSRKPYYTNVNSVITWSVNAANSQEYMQTLFGVYGYEYVPAVYSVLNEAEKYVQENDVEAYPKQGYIIQEDDYIIVNLGVD